MRARGSSIVLASIALAFASLGCGSDAPTRRAPARPASPAADRASSESGGAGLQARLDALAFEGAPPNAPITITRAHFGPGASLSITDTTTHETLIVVTSGTLSIAPFLAGGHDARVPLAPGTAVRIPPGTPAGDVRADPTSEAMALVARVRCGSDAPCREATPNGARGELALVEHTPELVVGGGRVRVKILFPLTADQRTGLSLERFAAEAGAAVPRHVHETSAEILVVESGRGTMHLGDREIDVHAGLNVYIPPGTPHDFACSEPLVAWQMYGPSGPEMRFRQAPDAGR